MHRTVRSLVEIFELVFFVVAFILSQYLIISKPFGLKILAMQRDIRNTFDKSYILFYFF